MFKIDPQKISSDKNEHAKFHSSNAFCGSAGPQEISHLQDLIKKLSDKELKLLVERVGIKFIVEEKILSREDYESVVDEADREDFYREYKKIVNSRKS